MDDLICRVKYNTQYGLENHLEDEVIEYTIKGTVEDRNIITMIGCGALFCEGECLEEGMRIIFEVKVGRKWQVIEVWTDASEHDRTEEDDR